MASAKLAQNSNLMVRSRVMRFVFKCLAVVCIILGFLGIFLPLLPTTPFLILAAFFSIRSSPTIHSWLIHHKTFGPPLQQYLKERSISKTVYWRALSVMWLTMGISIWMVSMIWVKCLLLVIATSVTVYLTLLKKRGVAHEALRQHQNHSGRRDQRTESPTD